MLINKFGTSLGRSRAKLYYQWNELLKNFVCDNALCMGAANFECDFAKSRKIRRVALPVDVANKRYVLQSTQILKDQQNEIDKKAVLQNNMQIMTNELQKIQQVMSWWGGKDSLSTQSVPRCHLTHTANWHASPSLYRWAVLEEVLSASRCSIHW